MITRVAIENLVVVEQATFEPGPGLTAVTGETGTGKTLLAAAIGLLFGADPDAGHVGPGADHAFVEGEFEVDEAFWRDPAVAAFADLRPGDDEPLVLARRVDASGRSRAFAWGRQVTKADLQAAGERLVATAGQHVQVRLRSAAFQRELVDAAGGEPHEALLGAMREAHGQLQRAERELAEVEEGARDAAARADRVLDELARIEAVDPSPEDEAELRAVRDRARNHAAIVEAAATGLEVLESDGGGIDVVGGAAAAVGRVGDADPAMAAHAETLLALQAQLGEVAGELRSGLDELADAPGRLEEVEDRLAAYDELQRAFGGTTEAVLEHLERVRREAELVRDADGAVARARAAHEAARDAAVAAAGQLRTSRQAIADRLESDVADLLAELGMGHSTFAIAIEPTAEPTPHGGDRIELRLAPSERHEPRPVAQAASGGELSRVALALLVATGAGDRATIVFDEVDAGLGGHTAHAVASLLRRLADDRQVVAITHLPQVAARASAHAVVERDGPTTRLEMLGGEEAVVDELCRMLGADAGDDAARQHARALRGPRIGTGARASGAAPAPGVASEE